MIRASESLTAAGWMFAISTIVGPRHGCGGRTLMNIIINGKEKLGLEE